MIGGEDGDYILRVKGDPMKDADPRGRLRGGEAGRGRAQRRDRGRAARARGDRQAVLPREGPIRLQPENPAYKPIRTRNAQLLGRVVGVFRSV